MNLNLNLNKLESEIVSCAALRDYSRIREIYDDLSAKRMKLDRWFDKYLDMFSEKLEEVEKTDPVKKLYNTKFDQYSGISRVIKVAEVYMRNKNV